MVGDVLHVEAVEAPARPPTAREGRTSSGAATIYWWQIALQAARAGALEHELGEVRRDLERERRERQRVIERYEKLLADRETEIEQLRTEADAGTDANGESDGLRSLLSR